MNVPTLEGIDSKTLSTSRLTTRVLFSGLPEGELVLFLHGNLSSATWWEEVMLALPEGYRGIAPDQRGYGEAEPGAKTDATRGLGDLADDAIALLDHMNIDKAHVVGHSMGGSVVWWLMRKYAHRLLTITQVAPGSPYGFGGTKDMAGTPCYEDFAGSGAGLINPAVVTLIAARDMTTDSPFTPRSAFRQLIVNPPFIPEREDAYILSMNSTHLGDDAYPGDAVDSPNWPGKAPGKMGVNNALSPKYAGDVSELTRITPKPPVLWVRGAEDRVVSDASASDPGTLGQMGLIPGWPGSDVYPPQPMIGQTRTVLDLYAAHGGTYREEIIADCAHSPYMEKPDDFNRLFHAHLKAL